MRITDFFYKVSFLYEPLLTNDGLHAQNYMNFFRFRMKADLPSFAETTRYYHQKYLVFQETISVFK